MLITYTLLAAITAASFQVTGAFELVTALVAFQCAMFYWYMANLMSGLSQTALNPNVNVYSLLGKAGINITAVIFVFNSDYAAYAYLAVPMIAIATYTNVLCILLKYEVIDIRDKDDEDEE